jgi:hypothetical protein
MRFSSILFALAATVVSSVAAFKNPIKVRALPGSIESALRPRCPFSFLDADVALALTLVTA